MKLLAWIRRKEAAIHPLVIVLWILSPIIAFFVGAATYDLVLEFNHLELFRGEDWLEGAAFLGLLVCLGVYLVLWPIVRFGFPKWYGRTSSWLWIAAACLLPIPAVFLEIAIDGLPWWDRIVPHLP